MTPPFWQAIALKYLWFLDGWCLQQLHLFGNQYLFVYLSVVLLDGWN
jgi:hypothetical protein